MTVSSKKKIIPFMQMKWIFLFISIVVVSWSLFVMTTKGFNFGVDFKGGIKLVYKFDEKVGDEELRTLLEPLELGDMQIVQYGKDEENSYLIKVKYKEGSDTAGEIGKKLNEKFGGKLSLLSEETVGPKVGAELRKRGIFAMILAWALILLYVGWRFDFLFPPGGIIALIHDVIVGVGVFVFFGKEINLPILAAALTLIGFSINDTIVVYDRVRENLRKLPTSIPLSEVIDISVTETLSRTIITSLTVLFSVLILYFFGGGVIKDFAFFMIVGVIAGTYSTMFIASPVYLALSKLFPHKGLRAAQK